MERSFSIMVSSSDPPLGMVAERVKIIGLKACLMDDQRKIVGVQV